MKLKVLNTKGKSVEDITLSDDVFGVVPNLAVLAQYVRVYLHNQRQGTASTKTRSEVSGSGKKPWAQKGTGRARAGTKRSPIWRTGGIAHGPKPKSWNLSLPKKARKIAIKSALSKRFGAGDVRIVDEFNLSGIKTKELAEVLKKVKAHGRILLVTGEKKDTVLKSAANLTKVETTFADVLNTYQLLKAKTVIFEKDAVKKLEKKYK